MNSIFVHSSIQSLLEKAPNSKRKSKVLKKYRKLIINDQFAESNSLNLKSSVDFSDVFINPQANPSLYKKLLMKWLSSKRIQQTMAQPAFL